MWTKIKKQRLKVKMTDRNGNYLNQPVLFPPPVILTLDPEPKARGKGKNLVFYLLPILPCGFYSEPGPSVSSLPQDDRRRRILSG